MKLSVELKRLDDMSNKLQMFLSGLRVPEELEGVIEYARKEAEEINNRVSYLSMMVDHDAVPDATVPDPLKPSEIVFSFSGEGRA